MTIPSSAKGKARETPSETTPLVESSTSNPHYSGDLESSPAADEDHSTGTVSNYLYTFLISSLSLFFLGVFLLILIGSSYFNRAPALHRSPSEIIEEGVAWQLRTVQLVDIQDDGVDVLVDSEIRIHTDWMLGIKGNTSAGWWETFRRGVGRWGIRRLRSVSVDVSTVQVRSGSPSESFGPLLFNITLPSFSINLVPSSKGQPSFTHLKFPVHVHPTTNTTDLFSFAQSSWVAGNIETDINIAGINIRGGIAGKGDWRSTLLNVDRNNVRLDFKAPSELIPHP